MPPVGGFVALCVTARGQTREAPKTKIYGDFSKIELTPNSDTLKGKLMINFNAYRICHGGIKVRLEGNLEVMGKNTGTECNHAIDVLEHCPAETILSCKSRYSFIIRFNYKPLPLKVMTCFMDKSG